MKTRPKPEMWPGKVHTSSTQIRTIAWPPPPPGFPSEDDDADGSRSEYADVLAYDPANLKNNALASTVIALAFLGVMPMTIKTRKLYFRSTLPLCLLVYALIWFVAVHLLMDKVPTVAGDVDLDVRMISLELTVHLLPLFYVPVVWLQSRNISRLSAAYIKIKNDILGPSGLSPARSLFYSAGTWVLLALCVVFSVGAVVFVKELHVPLWQAPALTYSFMIQTILWWNMVIQLLQANLLTRRVHAGFQKVTSNGYASATVVRDYRATWVKIRDMQGYDDVKGPVVYVLNLVYLICQCTMVSFEALTSYSTGRSWAFAAHANFSIIYLLEIGTLGDLAHRGVTQLKDPFVTCLDKLSLNNLDRETHTEVCLFYNTIISKPPQCSMRGFASLDRPFVASIFTTVISYLIFLAQFRANDEEDEPTEMPLMSM